MFIRLVRKRGKRRKPIKLSVTVAANNNINSCFGGNHIEEYSEIKDVYVDSRIRTLSFYEDLRPAYV
jgi:hypothetical protein